MSPQQMGAPSGVELSEPDPPICWPATLRHELRDATDPGPAPWDELVHLEVEVAATPGEWVSLDGRVLAADVATGNHDLFAATVPQTAGVTVWDPDGSLSPSGSGFWLQGSALRIRSRSATGSTQVLHYGRVKIAKHAGEWSAPAVELQSEGGLAWIATSGATARVAERADTRIRAILAAAGFAGTGVDTDATALSADDDTNPANQLARAVEAAGGILLEVPTETGPSFVYHPRGWLDTEYAGDPDLGICAGPPVVTYPDLPIAVPTAFPYEASLEACENVVTLGSSYSDGFTYTARDAQSVALLGEHVTTSGPTDLPLVNQVDLIARVGERLTARKWPTPQASPVEVTVYDGPSRDAVTLRPGAVVLLGYADDHGAPWAYKAMVTGVEHSVDAGTWTVAVYASALEAWQGPPVPPVDATGVTVLDAAGVTHADGYKAADVGTITWGIWASTGQSALTSGNARYLTHAYGALVAGASLHVIAGYTNGAFPILTMTDNQGGTYTRVARGDYLFSSPSGGRTEIWRRNQRPATPTAALTITADRGTGSITPRSITWGTLGAIAVFGSAADQATAAVVAGTNVVGAPSATITTTREGSLLLAAEALPQTNVSTQPRTGTTDLTPSWTNNDGTMSLRVMPARSTATIPDANQAVTIGHAQPANLETVTQVVEILAEWTMAQHPTEPLEA